MSRWLTSENKKILIQVSIKHVQDYYYYYLQTVTFLCPYISIFRRMIRTLTVILLWAHLVVIRLFLFYMQYI